MRGVVHKHGLCVLWIDDCTVLHTGWTDSRMFRKVNQGVIIIIILSLGEHWVIHYWMAQRMDGYKCGREAPMTALKASENVGSSCFKCLLQLIIPPSVLPMLRKDGE